MLKIYNIFFTIIILDYFCSNSLTCLAFSPVIPNQHPYPEQVVANFHSKVNHSQWRRKAQENSQSSCGTGNPIDDCWKCDTNWAENRQKLADCGIGFGSKTVGGKGGIIYEVTDPSDPSPKNPKTGTLRDAVTQPGPVWIVFATDMVIKLNGPLIVSSSKTIDGRGANIEITGGGCILILRAKNVIIHNINIHNCVPANSDGDAIHISASSNIWIDHCTLSNCEDGLIDCTEASTGITISNNLFMNHNKVILLGNSDDFSADRGMQITVAFNRFGEGLVQRMPRCRFGYFHVVNNDYTGWGEYAIGGSASPTINSQGNRYTAPERNKEVTRRRDANGDGWKKWDWRTENDLFVNGATFTPSGDGTNTQFKLSSSMNPLSAANIEQLTLNAGIFKGLKAATSGAESASGPGDESTSGSR